MTRTKVWIQRRQPQSGNRRLRLDRLKWKRQNVTDRRPQQTCELTDISETDGPCPIELVASDCCVEVIVGDGLCIFIMKVVILIVKLQTLSRSICN